MAALDESAWVAILTAIQDHALSSGLFEAVNGHEPASPPLTGGLTAALWVGQIRPVPASGLAASSGVLTVNVRVQMSMSHQPQDEIETKVLAAVNTLMVAYSGDFELGGDKQLRNVDLLGAYGEPLSAKAGYINQDNQVYRVMVITLPLVINDLWAQAA
jgi:hypothetical protein